MRLDHLRQYAADLLLLNEGAQAKEEGVFVPDSKGTGGGRRVHLLPVAPPAGTSEVETLDASKKALCRGLKDGFSAAWDALAPEGLAEEYPGAEIAAQLFDAEGDVAEFDAAWQRYSAIFGPLLEGGGGNQGAQQPPPQQQQQQPQPQQQQALA